MTFGRPPTSLSSSLLAFRRGSAGEAHGRWLIPLLGTSFLLPSVAFLRRQLGLVAKCTGFGIQSTQVGVPALLLLCDAVRSLSHSAPQAPRGDPNVKSKYLSGLEMRGGIYG